MAKHIHIMKKKYAYFICMCLLILFLGCCFRFKDKAKKLIVAADKITIWHKGYSEAILQDRLAGIKADYNSEKYVIRESIEVRDKNQILELADTLILGREDFGKILLAEIYRVRLYSGQSELACFDVYPSASMKSDIVSIKFADSQSKAYHLDKKFRYFLQKLLDADKNNAK